MEYTDRYKAFCKRMSIYRKLMDYDQAKMAVRVGMTTPEYSNREAGRSMVSGIDLRKFSDSGADIDKMSTFSFSPKELGLADGDVCQGAFL